MALLETTGALASKVGFDVYCALCNEKFSYSMKLHSLCQHAILCHGIRVFEDLLRYFNGKPILRASDLLCGQCYNIYGPNTRHFSTEHKINDRYYCKLCNFTTTRASLYQFHNHILKSNATWCIGCNKFLMRSNWLSSHFRICPGRLLSYKRDYEIANDHASTEIHSNTIELKPKPYVFPNYGCEETLQTLKGLKVIDKAWRSQLKWWSCRLCSKPPSIKCRACSTSYCATCQQVDPYLCTKMVCMRCYMHAYSVWNDPVLVFTKGLFGILSGFTRPRNSTSLRNSRGLAMHGPYAAKAGAIVSEALALAVPLDRLNIPYGLERLVEATQYDDNGMPCFLADFGPYVFFAGSVMVPPLYFARDSSDPMCRLEVTLLAGLNIGYPVAVVTLRAVKDFAIGRNKVREITIRRQCLTEYPWRGAARFCLDPILAIPPQHKPTELPPDTPCPRSAFSQYFAGKSPFGEPKESLVSIQ
ncbi:hypothetical protein GL50803_0021485 [Giardia duodenalis]|uniref:Uncharacterized protein n=1 Tax=Giardia intestinalis (strain ATCC 50803 / WB clone C6) TaxID=184922 RepID=A8BIJ3_GIAIC|nr:hypothetical protein GL50803_0021485 [Giardia intestinalis]KAE8305628.1 hypothetical protein GL50803_0021485 [Giardia intestinalis]|eukprot:XP_001706851.1 Hypothetical protein GL50803_21485 [Giardia lamblia ATCC 50803]